MDIPLQPEASPGDRMMMVKNTDGMMFTRPFEIIGLALDKYLVYCPKLKKEFDLMECSTMPIHDAGIGPPMTVIIRPKRPLVDDFTDQLMLQ